MSLFERQADRDAISELTKKIYQLEQKVSQLEWDAVVALETGETGIDPRFGFAIKATKKVPLKGVLDMIMQHLKLNLVHVPGTPSATILESKDL